MTINYVTNMNHAIHNRSKIIHERLSQIIIIINVKNELLKINLPPFATPHDGGKELWNKIEINLRRHKFCNFLNQVGSEMSTSVK
jgi:hypothetical protein